MFVKDKLSSAYEKGKQTKSSFKPKQCSFINGPFSLLHMDLYGPVLVASRAGKRFSVVIVDECFHFTWVVFLSNKDDVVDEMISLLKQWEIQF